MLLLQFVQNIGHRANPAGQGATSAAPGAAAAGLGATPAPAAAAPPPAAAGDNRDTTAPAGNQRQVSVGVPVGALSMSLHVRFGCNLGYSTIHVWDTCQPYSLLCPAEVLVVHLSWCTGGGGWLFTRGARRYELLHYIAACSAAQTS